jgi:hypothetical protein
MKCHVDKMSLHQIFNWKQDVFTKCDLMLLLVDTLWVNENAWFKLWVQETVDMW